MHSYILYLLSRPDLKDDHYGVVTQLLHKLGFVWGDFVSFLVHHVLQINLVEAISLVITNI